MDLLSRFWTSPEVSSQATVNAGQIFRQATESATKLMQSGALLQLMQRMLKNYTEFLAEFSQSGMAMMNQGQAARVHQVQEATDSAVDAAEVSGCCARLTA